MLGNEQRIEIAIHRGGSLPGARDFKGFNVNELDFGPLLASLTKEPHLLANMEEGSLKLEITRTHEWELVLGLVVAGSVIFAEAVISKVAERIVDWTLEQAQSFAMIDSPQVRSPEGEKALVDAANLAASVEGVYTLLKEATEQHLRVTLTIEPGE